MADEERQTAGVLEAVVDYWGRGWAVIDWPVGKKGTTEKWAEKRYDDVQVLRAVFGDNRKNIGVKLGKFSGDLVDVDLDCEEAVTLADRFLPRTGAVFGRSGNPRSHRLYYAGGAKYREFATPKTGDQKKQKLLELRSTGQQTIFPPSVHPTGEHYQWYEGGEPPAVEPAALERACQELATAVVLARTLPNRGDGRHHFLLPATGFLLRDGRLDEGVVADLLKAAGDTNGYSDEEEQREWYAEVDRAVKDTLEKLKAGTPVQGGGELEKQMPSMPGAIAKLWGWEKSNGDKPTDDELSDRWLARSVGERAYGLGTWMRYEAGAWKPLAEAVVRREVVDVLRAAKAERIRPTASLLHSVETLSRIAASVPDEEWDGDPDVLVCANGTLHIPTAELRGHNPEHHAISAVPYEYDPSAEAPTWERFLREVAGESIAPFLQEFAGYALTTDTSHELALWLYGPPGGGRSTFLAGLGAMLGPRAGLLGLSEIQRNRFALADIPGKTLLTATEQPAGYLRTSHVLNALISGEPIQVERKYRDPFVLVPRAKIAWAMNELPRVGSASDGLFRRVKVLRFEGIPESERDPAIKSAIEGEGAGILNWALAGLERLRERGRFEVPEAVRDATARWKETNDVPALFVAEACTRDERNRAGGQELYYMYKYWCEKNGHKPKSSTSVAEDWQRLGFERKRIKGRTYYVGLSVPTEAEQLFPGF